MINVREHFYDDDPKQGHPDVRTRLKNAFYFFLGNGLIQAAVQVAPSGEGTPIGLLVMHPEELAKKRDALTMSPESGLEDTRVQIQSEKITWDCRQGVINARWSKELSFPAVRASWENAFFKVDECFYCPDSSQPVLVREVRVKNLQRRLTLATVVTGCRGFFVGGKLTLKAGEAKQIFFQYALDRARKKVRLSLETERKPLSPILSPWERSSEVIFDSALLNHFFFSARSQMAAVISKSGRVDGSIWQYNREWVRDQANLTIGLTLSGFHQTARTVLKRLLREFVTEEGQTIDSSEIRHPEEVELDQNGALLHALKHYFLWTGDGELMRENWKKIRATANFLLRPIFRHQPSGLLANQREFWERHRAFGIHKGMELAYQLYASIGLADAAFLARLIGRKKEAFQWEIEAHRIKQACLFDRRFSLVEEGQLIKRRLVDGTVQKSIQPSAALKLPREMPLARGKKHWLNPDTSTVLPIALNFIPADSELAKKTLAAVELLWNQAWRGGGYGRYHVSSEPDSPGPWPFPSLFVARAYVEMSEGEKVWRILNWLKSLPGSQSGAWFEFYGERSAPPFPQVGIPPWTWAELILLLVHHVIGIRPQLDHLLIRPKLLPDLRKIKASFPFRNVRLTVEIMPESRKQVGLVQSNSQVLWSSDKEAAIGYSNKDIEVKILSGRYSDRPR